MKHLAWLHATPKTEKNTKSRMEQFKLISDEHPYLEMPAIDNYVYLIDWLFELGPTMQSSMGSSPLTFEEIRAWGIDIDLSPWEASTLRRLSLDYLSMLHTGSEPKCPPPFVARKQSEERTKQVSNGLKDLFMQIAKRG